MADIAQLGLQVDSRQVLTANRNLATFSRTSADTERRVRTSTEKMERNFASLRNSVGLVGGALAGLGGAVALGGAVRTIAKFEQAMSTVKAVAGATVEEFEALESKAQELGANTRFSATQAAEGMLYLSRAGFEANESLASIEDTLNLAQAGALDLGMAADIVSNVMQGFSLQADQAKRSVDVLAFAANNANTNVAQFGDAMKYVAPVAAGMGVEFETAAAAVGALSDAGLQASMAGTGLRRVISELESPSKKTSDILSSMGVTAEEVRVSQVGLVESLERLEKAGIDTGQSLEIFGDRGGPAFQVLSDAIPKIKSLNSELRDAAGYAKSVADEMDNNLNGALLANASAAEAVVLAFADLGGSNVLTKGFLGSAGALRSLAENADIAAKSVGLLALAFGTRLAGAMGASIAESVRLQAANAATLKSEKLVAGAALRRAQVEDAAAARAVRTAKMEFDAARATNARALALDNLTRAQIAASGASDRMASAQARATAANSAYTRGATAAGVATRGLSGAMALVGGPVGAAVLAAAAIYSFRDELGLMDDPKFVQFIEDISDGFSDTKDQIAEATTKIIEFSKAADEYLQPVADLLNYIAGGGAANDLRGMVGLSPIETGAMELDPIEVKGDKLLSSGSKGLDFAGNEGENKPGRTPSGAGGSESSIDRRIQALRQELALHGDLSRAEETRIAIEQGFLGAVTARQKAQAIAMAEELDRKDRIADMREEEIERVRELVRAEQERKDIVSSLEQELMTDTERSSAALKRRLELIRQNVTDSQKALELTSRAMLRFREETEQNMGGISAFAEQAARNIQDQLGDTLSQTLRGDFDGILDSWSQMLIDMAAQAQAAQLNKMLFGDLGSQGGGGDNGILGTALSTIGSAVGSYFGGPSSASVGQSFADAGIGGMSYGTPSGFGGAYASGGTMPADKWSLVGEQGPELVRPSTPTTVLPNGTQPQGGSANVVMHVQYNEAEGKTQEERRGDQENFARELKTQVQSAFVSDMSERGPMSRAMQGTFNLKRTGS